MTRLALALTLALLPAGAALAEDAYTLPARSRATLPM